MIARSGSSWMVAVMRASSGDQGGAVVVARLKPDTISSLLMWVFKIARRVWQLFLCPSY